MEETPASEAQTGEEAVYAGFPLLWTERRAVVSSRGEHPGFAGWGFLLGFAHELGSPQQAKEQVKR